MMRQQKHWSAMLVLLLSLVSSGARAESHSGRIVGIACAEQGHLCPATKFEQHITREQQFVLFGTDKTYHKLTNISRDTLVRYVSTEVIIDGMLDQNSNTIHVTKLRVLRPDALSDYELVWQAP